MRMMTDHSPPRGLYIQYQQRITRQRVNTRIKSLKGAVRDFLLMTTMPWFQPFRLLYFDSVPKKVWKVSELVSFECAGGCK